MAPARGSSGDSVRLLRIQEVGVRLGIGECGGLLGLDLR